MTADDIRQSARLAFPAEVNWVVLPRSFPFSQFAGVHEWAQFEAFSVYFGHYGRDAAPPDEDWYRRTRQLIALGQQDFGPREELYRFLVFYDVDVAPIPVFVRIFLGELPWAEARPLYSGALDPGRVEGPFVEDFAVPDAVEGLRALRYHHLDPEEGTLVALYDYAFRKHGLDVAVRAEFIDLSTIRPALPTIDAFVRGIEMGFGDDSAVSSDGS